MSRDILARHNRVINLILSVLDGTNMKLYDIQCKAGKKNISRDTVKTNVDKLVDLGLVIRYVEKKEPRPMTMYKKVDGVFCAWGCLLTQRPLALFPCEFFFECNYTGEPGEICKKMEWAMTAFGAKRLTVTRVFPEEVRKQ